MSYSEVLMLLASIIDYQSPTLNASVTPSLDRLSFEPVGRGTAGTVESESRTPRCCLTSASANPLDHAYTESLHHDSSHRYVSLGKPDRPRPGQSLIYNGVWRRGGGGGWCEEGAYYC